MFKKIALSYLKLISNVAKTIDPSIDDYVYDLMSKSIEYEFASNNIEKNMINLGRELLFKRVDKKDDTKKNILFIGQPGSGKSSIIRNLTNKECVPLPEIGQSTDITNWSTELKENLLITYKNINIVDAPGYDTYTHDVKTYLDLFPFDMFSKINILFNNKLHASDIKIMSKIGEINSSSLVKINIIRTFSENLSNEEKESIKNDIKYNFERVSNLRYEIHFFSNRTKEGLEKLKNDFL